MDKSIFELVSIYFTKIINEENIQNSSDIRYPEEPFSKVIGQDAAVEVIKQAMIYRRHVLLIGLPGTGKSLLARCAMTIWPKIDLKIISTTNLNELNKPILYHYEKPFDWYKYAEENKFKRLNFKDAIKIYFLFSAVMSIFATLVNKTPSIKLPMHPILYLCLLLNPYVGILGTLNAILRELVPFNALAEGTCIYDNTGKQHSSFIDATGCSPSLILGDISHDPLAGLHLSDPTNDKTYKLLRAGAVHRAHKGVLYIDEIGTINKETQYALLTIIEERVAGIKPGKTGGGAGVESANKVPADFSLIMAGNPETVEMIHSALRSRIKGYGYEIVMNTTMPVTLNNTKQILHFVAREIKEGNHLPFNNAAMLRIIQHAITMSRSPNQYTLELRNFKGIIRITSDHAKLKHKEIVDIDDVLYTLKNVGSLELMLANSINREISAIPKIDVCPVILLMNFAEGLKSVEETVPVLSHMKFYTSKNVTGSSIEIHNLRVHHRDYAQSNKLMLTAKYVYNKLEHLLNLDPQNTVNIHFIDTQYIHRYMLQLDNLIFTILGHYYRPLNNTIYIGEVSDTGLVKLGIKSITLIDTALNYGYEVVTSRDGYDMYHKNKSVKYIYSIEDLKGSQTDLWL